jgi:hypothetical protein
LPSGFLNQKSQPKIKLFPTNNNDVDVDNDDIDDDDDSHNASHDGSNDDNDRFNGDNYSIYQRR